jgi:predicted dehydrogenase
MSASTQTIGVGIIGPGSRGITCLGFRMAELCRETGLKVIALCDRYPDRLEAAKNILVDKFSEHGITIDPALYSACDELIHDNNVDLIIITTPTFLHRESAILALRTGKKVYLDKPIAHTAEDAVAIVEEETATANKLIMGFTRRYEAPWQKLHSLLKEGVIGELKMMQFRAVIPYWHYFQTWHRRRKWSGGGLNDKSSHHCDVFNWFAGSRSVQVNGFGGRSMFHPRQDAPERCLECKNETCPYRATWIKTKSQDEMMHEKPPAILKEREEVLRKDTCVYYPGADIIDHASIHFRYQNGIVANLLYTNFGPHADDQETFELIGTKGRMILTRHTGMIDIIGDYGERREVMDCKSKDFESSHFGADLKLVCEMRRFYDGRTPEVSACDGLEATRMVLAALKSIDNTGQTVQMEEIPDAHV